MNLPLLRENLKRVPLRLLRDEIERRQAATTPEPLPAPMRRQFRTTLSQVARLHQFPTHFILGAAKQKEVIAARFDLYERLYKKGWDPRQIKGATGHQLSRIKGGLRTLGLIPRKPIAKC